MNSRRRLAAVMFTDMVGFTALGQRNEALSLTLLEEQRALVRPLLSIHHGREIKTIGDAFLIEFDSALEAVRCAFEIQRVLRDRNLSLPEDRKIHLRIGVHVGDVVEIGGDISGDAVNVASRIESLAPSGGVCLTRQVYDSVENKFGLPLSTLGMRTLKNVSTPLEIFKIDLPWESSSRSPRRFERRRIAVLPFANFSPDPSDEYFADGITEEIISTLSRVSGLGVISRTSVMRYKSHEKGIAEIARELNVGAVLEGSVRKADDELRISVQLIDVQNDEHLWSEVYNRKLENVFFVQSDIALRVSKAMKLRLLSEKSEKAQVSSDAFTLYLRAKALLNTRQILDCQKAIPVLEKVIEEAPEFASAYVALASCYIRLNEDLIRSEDALPRAESLLRKALELEETSADAHDQLGFLLRMRWDWAGAEREYRRAIELNPSQSMALSHLGHLIYSNNLVLDDSVLDELKKAQELDPMNPGPYINLGLVYMSAGQYDQSLQECRKALELAPSSRLAHLCAGFSYQGKNQLEDAIREEELGQDGTAHSISHLAYMLAFAGRLDEAEKLIREMEEMDKTGKPVMHYIIAEAYAAHNLERTFQELEIAFERKEGYLAGGGATSGPFMYLKHDPRFRAIVTRMGLRWPSASESR